MARTATSRLSRLAAAAAALTAASAPAQIVGFAARVNGAEITMERLDTFFEAYAAAKGRMVASFRNPEAYKRWKREALDVLIDEELLFQESQRTRIAVSETDLEAALAEQRARFRSPDAFARQVYRSGYTERTFPEFLRRQIAIERLLKQEIAGRQRVTRAEVHARYAESPQRYAVPVEVRARHVLARVEPAAPEERKAAARRRIEEIRSRARSGEDFAELARRLSDDDTAAAGGDLGFFARGRMVPAFEEAAFALAPGAISEVVETVYGYHVIQALERRGGERIPEKQVVDMIRKELLAEKTQKAVRDRLDLLRRSAKIEIVAPLQLSP